MKPFNDKKTVNKSSVAAFHDADQMTTQALYDVFPLFSWLQGEKLKRLFL